MKFNDYKEQIKSMGEKQDYEWEAFLKAHSKKNPAPSHNTPKPDVVFWASILAALASMTVSGLRVYDRFYQVAFQAGASADLANFEAIAAIIAVNVTVVVLSMAVAYKHNKHSMISIYVGLGIALIISVFAGLGQSFHGLKLTDLVQGVDFLLALSMTGITGLEYFTGEAIGTQYVVWLDAKKKFEAEYDYDYAEWLKLARRAFPTWMLQLNTFIKHGGETVVAEPKQRQEEVDTEKLDWRTAVRGMTQQDIEFLSTASTSQIRTTYPSLSSKAAPRWREYALEELKNRQ